MLKKLRALGAYLKDTHNQKPGLYSALFLTTATIAFGGVLGVAALGAATMANAVGMVVGGVTGIGLGVYAGAPMVREFVSGAAQALKDAKAAEKDTTNKPSDPTATPSSNPQRRPKQPPTTRSRQDFFSVRNEHTRLTRDLFDRSGPHVGNTSKNDPHQKFRPKKHRPTPTLGI